MTSDARALERALAAAHAEMGKAPTPSWKRDAGVVVGVQALLMLGAVAALSWTTTQHASALALYGGLVLWCLTGLVAAYGAIAPSRWAQGASAALLVAATASWLLGSTGVARVVPFAAGRGCAFLELALAVVPLTVTLWAQRRFARHHVRSTLAGLSAGIAGLAALHVHCTDGSADHFLYFHAAPLVLLLTVSRVIRARLPTRSYAP
jgi:hypothetical protein